MRLALTDVKKSVVRREGEAYLVPHLLRRRDLRDELGRLIHLHEEWRGRTRVGFPSDRPSEIVGDYRLARGLVSTLGDWYVWEPRAWPGHAGARETAALEQASIASAAQLRLALFDAVQAEAGGYLPTERREHFLDVFAGDLGIERSTLDALLVLDGEEQACLRRLTPEPPTPNALAARYNWHAVEAVLSAASSVTWILPPAFAAARGTTLGTLLKRVCFLARRTGIAYEAEYASEAASAPNEGLPLVAERRAAYAAPPAAAGAGDRQGPISVELYGPQEAFGGATQYGERLARLCRTILGLNRVGGEGAAAARGANGLRGAAVVHLRSRPFRFALDERLLALLLPGADEESDGDAQSTELTFDSTLERQLHVEFAALERAQATHGWHIEREPEPILCDWTILIPDFALSRGTHRVYLELAGYWSPGYRERKCRKLLALAGRVELIVAAPDDSREAFRALEAVFPCVWYAQRPTARQLLAALGARWDDFASRRAAVGHEALLREVARRGVLPVGELGASLNVHDRTELARVVADVGIAARSRGMAEPVLLEGLGLVSTAWLANAGSSIARILLETGAEMPLRALAGRLRQTVPELRDAADDDATTEALARACGCTVDRADFFVPVVRAPGQTVPEESAEDESAAVREPRKRTQPHRPRRRKVNDGVHAMPIQWDDAPG